MHSPFFFSGHALFCSFPRFIYNSYLPVLMLLISSELQLSQISKAKKTICTEQLLYVLTDMKYYFGKWKLKPSNRDK